MSGGRLAAFGQRLTGGSQRATRRSQGLAVYDQRLTVAVGVVVACGQSLAACGRCVNVIGEYLPAFDAAKRNRVAYKDLMREGKTLPGVPSPTTPQAIPSATVAVTAPPATAVLPNIELRMRLLIKQLKASPAYTLAIGTDLGIIVPSNSPAETKPKPSGAVALTWTKGKHDGVIIECKRGTETAFTFLDRDFKSPYVDTRPNALAGVPELRTYRLRYEKDGSPVGPFCDDVKVSTLV